MAYLIYFFSSPISAASAPSALIPLPLVSRLITSPLACGPLSAPLITSAGPARAVFTTHRISVGDNRRPVTPQLASGAWGVYLQLADHPQLSQNAWPYMSPLHPQPLATSPLPHVPPPWSFMYVAAPNGETREKVNIPGGSLTHKSLV